jgi:hypothetical protein
MSRFIHTLALWRNKNHLGGGFIVVDTEPREVGIRDIFRNGMNLLDRAPHRITYIHGFLFEKSARPRQHTYIYHPPHHNQSEKRTHEKIPRNQSLFYPYWYGESESSDGYGIVDQLASGRDYIIIIIIIIVVVVVVVVVVIESW